MLRFLLPVLIFGLLSFVSLAPGVDLNLKLVKKDLARLYDLDDAELLGIEVPDSLYNALLLDNGHLYSYEHPSGKPGYIYIGRIYSCRAGGCSVDQEPEDLSNSSDEDFEYFDYYTVFGVEMEVIKVKVYNYQATHGQAICSAGWLKQFIGYNGVQRLTYGKDIDGISGATISANAITYAVQESAQYLKLLQPLLEQTRLQDKTLVTK